MDKKQIFKKLNNGEIKLYQIEKYTDKKNAIHIRREFIEKKAKCKLTAANKYAFNEDRIYGKNCENVIGGVSLPVGLSGPILVKGNSANGEYYAPIATTEGALVASINRGAKVLTQSGGVKVISEYKGMTRAPLFRCKNIESVSKFKKWFRKNFNKIKIVGDKTDKFLKVKEYDIYSNGKNVWVRFVFDTSDAMGMNMAVIATKSMCEYIEKEFKKIRTIAISGNLCVDKKPAALNLIKQRGWYIEAEAIISKNLIEKNLKSSIEQIYEVNKNKIWVGGQMSGALGFNAHTANMIAGVFIATGQDPSHVVEGSLSSTNIEVQGDELYVHVFIPSLNIGTVGGGTGLANQKEYTELLLSNTNSKIHEKKNTNKTQKYAEILAAIIMAGELSLHAAFASKTFVKAHSDLGRGK